MARGGRLRISALLLIGLLLVAAVGLRLPKLTSRPLWFDEVYQVTIAEAPSLWEMAALVAVKERNPPAGYVFTRAGLMLSRNEFGSRLPSLVFGVSCVPLAWVAGRLWSNRTAAAWAAVFAAAAPAYVFYSREARVYALGVAAVFGLIAAAGWFRLRPNWGSGVVFALATVVAVSIQYAGAIVTAAWLLAMWLAPPPVGPKRAVFRLGWLVSSGLAALAVGVWVVGYLLPQLQSHNSTTSDFPTNFWQPASPESIVRFVTGPVPEFFQYLFLAGETGPRWMLLALVAGCPAIIAVGAALRPNADRRLRVIVTFTVTSVGAFVILAGCGLHPFGGIRHCLPLTPGFLLLVAIGLARVAKFSKPIGLGWGLLGLGLMGYGMVHTSWHKHDHGVRPLVAAVAEKEPGGKPVIIVGGAVNTFKYYEQELRWPGTVVYCGSYVGEPAEREFEAAFQELLLAHGQVWVIEFTPVDPDADVTRLIGNSARPSTIVNESRARGTLWVATRERTGE